MPGPKKVTVDIVGDAKGYQKATEDAVKASAGFSGKMDALDRKLEAMGKRGGVTGAILGGVGMGAGLGAFSLIERGIGSVVGAMGDAVQSAIEDERATAKLTQTIRANVTAWDGHLAAVNAAIDAGAQLAFTDDEVRDGLNALIPRTHDLTEAIKLNRLAMDLARAKNMDLGEAAGLVGKAYSGQASALRRAGIAIKNTKDSTKALAELQAAVSGQAETYGSTTEGAMKRADIAGSEAMESLGYAIKPLVTTFADLAAKTIPAVLGAFGSLGDALHTIQRLANPTMRDAEDMTLAILAQAPAMGANADSAIRLAASYRQVTADAAETADLVSQLQDSVQDTDPEIVRLAQTFGKTNDAAKNKAISLWAERIRDLSRATGVSIKDLTVALDLYGETYHSVGKLYQRMDDITASYRDATGASKEVTLSLDEQASQFLVTAKAADDIGAAVRGLIPDFAGTGKSITTSARLTKGAVDTIEHNLDPLAGIVRGSVKAAQKEAERDMADLKWALTHPMSDKRLRKVWKGELDDAYAALHEAQRTGNRVAIAKAQHLIDELKGKLAELDGARFQLLVDLQYQTAQAGMTTALPPPVPGQGGGSKPRKPKHKKAAGGDVEEGVPVEVGERGREVFVPDEDGYIVPNGALGRLGGRTSVVINQSIVIHAGAGTDPVQLGAVVTNALRAYNRNGGAAAIKAAVSG